MDGYRPDTYGDAFADVYDDWYVDLPDPDDCGRCLRDLAAAGPVLELGVGTGRVAFALQTAGLGVIGLDASTEMLDVLAKKTATMAAELDPPLSPVLGDMAVLPLRRASVGGVVATFNTLFNLTTERAQQACVTEAARVLRPGGVFVVEAIVAPDPPDRIDDVSVRTIALGRVVLTASVLDPIAQTITGQHIEITESGNKLRPWMLRYLTTPQLDELALAVGLRLEARWSDWIGSTFVPDGSDQPMSRSHVSIYRRT